MAGCGDDGGGDDDDDVVEVDATAAAGVDASAAINGCTMAAAKDVTSAPLYLITGEDPWEVGHQSCIIVSAGADVLWQGDFTLHPLVGGVPPTTDAASPITQASADAGDTVVTFAAAGTFPYFCTVHGAAMQGVVYVVP